MESDQIVQVNQNRTLILKLILRTILALFGAASTPAIIALSLGLAGIFSDLLDGKLIQDEFFLTRSFGLIFLIFVVSSLHTVILGIPAFILGWYFKRIRWWTSVVVSFFVGALPTAIFLWPLKYPELHSTSKRWDGESMVYTKVDGVPTLTGWTDWISAFTVMGLIGVCGGIAFWLIWSWQKKLIPPKKAT